MDRRYQEWLLELTGLPTAAGCEQAVVDWVLRWARRRRGVTVRRDPYGNLLIQRPDHRKRHPILLAAHMDHPAFVVTERLDDRTVKATFRGGVEARFFVGSPVVLHGGPKATFRGTVVRLKRRTSASEDRSVTVRFSRKIPRPILGHVMTWDTGPARIKKQRLFAPACDDLAGVAAALSAFDRLGRRRGAVAVLLTRAEEIGFIGAIGACTNGFIPPGARIIVLECSRSYDESPVGGGPVVRVGDRTSTFDPGLTGRLHEIAKRISVQDPSFLWQRRLMPGGTCEATAYQAYGYTAACLCLPLGHYHNMNTNSGAIEAETISVSDYHGLIRWLVAAVEQLDRVTTQGSLRGRFDQLLDRRRELLVT